MQRVTEVTDAVLPPVIQHLFLLFSLYLVVPLIDLPILGLSLSAPLMGLVALNVIFGQRARQPRPNLTLWLIVAYLFWVGLLLSLAANMLLVPGFSVTTSALRLLIQFGYWLIVFIVTAWIVSVESPGFIRRLVMLIGLGGVGLALLRLAEAVLFGRWGAWTHAQIMSQNSYGIHFSMAAPFVALLPLIVPRRWRGAALVGILLLLAAMAGNGSRSSWIGGGAAILILLGLVALAQPQHISRFAVTVGIFISLLIVGVSLAPQSVLEPVAARFATFQAIDEDKSYQIRVLMTQKSLRLLETDPLFGIGLDGFRDARVPLNIPLVLDYDSQSHFDEKSSHNAYMGLLAEVGLAGFAPYALLLITLAIRGGIAALRLGRRGELWAFAAYAGFIGMSIHLWTLSGLTDTFPWFMYGLVAAMIQRDRATRAAG